MLDGCDAVYVCTWTSEHPRLVAAAVERGLAVFCEKPLATTLAAAEAMAAAVAGVGRHEPGRADPPAVPGVRLGPPPRRGTRAPGG